MNCYMGAREWPLGEALENAHDWVYKGAMSRTVRYN
jgi:hypothetical protein